MESHISWTIPPDPYLALGLNRGCSPQIIKARYYQLARRYHPNRNYGTHEDKHALAGHFHRIHEAWLLLNKPEQRKRYLEMIELAELQDEVEHGHTELSGPERDKAGDEELASSDAEDYGPTHVSAIRRARSPMGDFASDVENAGQENVRVGAADGSLSTPKPTTRGRGVDRRETHPPVSKPGGGHARGGSDAQAAARRRRKLEKYKKRELEAFWEYKDAMLAKLEAEMEAERLRAQYDTAKWRREKAENAPREASTRVRLVQKINQAVTLFKAQATHKLQRRPTLNLRTQILGAGDSRNENFLTVNSPSASRHPGRDWRGWSSDISGDQTSSEDEGTHAAARNHRRSPSILSGRPRNARAPAINRTVSAPDAEVQSIVDQEEDMTVNSPSITRTLGSHWEGWHSDISGDQSEDEGTNDAPRSHRRSPLMPSVRPLSRPSIRPPLVRPRRAPAPAVNSTVYALDTEVYPTGDQEEDVEPPLILIRRPTGFDSPLASIAPDSDDGSASASQSTVSSRSPSPAHRPSHDLVLFSQEHYNNMTATAHPHNRTIFAIKVIGNLRFTTYIPRDHVHKLELADETRLLKPPSDEGSHPDQLLQRLQQLDKRVAERFMVKPDVKAEFAFRLIYNSRHFVRQMHSSFIALSYRRKLTVVKRPGYYTLPLEPEMLQAVWEERISDHEGLWIDQICIDQDSNEEKTISMSAMDMVYRSARLVVVALDDLELTRGEGDVLAKHVLKYEGLGHVASNKRLRRQQTPYLEGRDGFGLLQVLQKLLSSSWFRRAWCRHEMRLARDHVFLLPCRTSDYGPFQRTVLRLTSECIAHLIALATEVPFDAKIESLKPALHAFFRERTQPTSNGTDFTSHHGNFSTVVAEVFGMEAGGDPRLPEEEQEADARRDKVSIILNTMECGLALNTRSKHGRVEMSKEDCYYSLLLLALAAGDPGALCSVGKPLRIPAQEAVHRKSYQISSWLFEPTNVDAGLNNYKTLDRLPTSSEYSTGFFHGHHFIKLELHLLSANMDRASDNPETLSLAESFVSTCETRKLGRHRKRYLLRDVQANNAFGDMHAVYSETLACVFACGPDWMSQICARHGVSRFKLDFEPACWLMVALRTMNGQWPQADWVDRAAGFMMDFVNFLVIRGMPQRSLRQPEAWRPSVMKMPNGGRLLMFMPPGEKVRAAVPSMLLQYDYVHLARIWMLVPRTADSKWTLRGKSVMFGDDAALSQITSKDDEGQVVRRQQEVYGRDVEEL
jgi:curved DNA-binding protein CbpA